MPRRVTLPGFERLKRQIENLEWLLAESGFDARRWKHRIAFWRDDGKIALELQLSRDGRKIRLSSTSDPELSASHGIGERHFWIEGNHHYDEFAVGTLTELLAPSEKEREIFRLCELAGDALNRVETGDDAELAKLIAKVRKRV